MDQYLVVGNPIAQSKSPVIHQHFAEQTQQQITYDKKLIALDKFDKVIAQLIANGVKGINVTAPFKEQAFELCDQLSDFAAKAGAVNTLIVKDGKLVGDNTDGKGLVNDLLNHQVQLENKTILLLGAGGAAKGVVAPLLAQQPKQLIVANRTIAKAEQIAEQYPAYNIQTATFEQLEQVTADVIINATSAGLNGQVLPISGEIFTKDVVCYDMTYAKSLTPFLTYAKENGSNQLIDGLGMLVGQAAESFYLWRGVRPNSANVIAMLREQM